MPWRHRPWFWERAHLVEDCAFVANDYIADMIVVTPQLDDWGQTSAQKAIALTRWMLMNYNIDPGRVYLSGYSGGGENVSIVMGMHPELYRRVLHLSSQWDGNTDVLVLDVKPASYFSGYTGQGGQHSGGAVLFSQDPDIMGWLFQ